MIKWIAVTKDTMPPKDGEYFVSNGVDITTSYYEYSMFGASSHVESSYDMAICTLDMAVMYWAYIPEDILPKSVDI